jgi:hypothetical protein
VSTKSGDLPSQCTGASGVCDATNSHRAVPTVRQSEAATNASDVDVDQQLLRKSAGGDRLADVPLPNVPLPDAYLTEGSQDGSVGEVPTSPFAAGEEIVIVFGLGSCSCLVRFLYSNL